MQPIGSRFKLEAVGLRTQRAQFFSPVLSAEDLARVRVATESFALQFS